MKPPAKPAPRVFSGMQPTGNLHLGNYLGAMVNWIAMQKTHECIYCVVDLHAITVWQEPTELRKAIRDVTAAYLACGLDPKRSIIFNQSQVAAHAELAWIFNCVARLGWLARSAVDARYFVATRDGSGARLHGDCEYEIAGPLPDADWWSLAVYDEAGMLIDSGSDRHAITGASAVSDSRGIVTIRLAGDARPGTCLWRTRRCHVTPCRTRVADRCGAADQLFFIF